MTASFGIDHPLLATHDIEALRNRLILLGFNMTPIGKHPWGTSTSLAMFQGCLLEIMGIYDASLIDQLPAGNFHFGRHIYEHLTQREGVALTALHSTNAQADAAQAQAAGLVLAGQLEFGREVTLPDGRKDRTKTTLALLPDPAFPRLSFFMCQQHRPELIYVPEWLAHPNTVSGICGVTILADSAQQAALVPRLSALYGPAAQIAGGYAFATANGIFSLQDRNAIEATFTQLPAALTDESAPAVVAMDLTYSSAEAFSACLTSSGLPFVRQGPLTLLGQPEATANTWLRFRQASS